MSPSLLTLAQLRERRDALTERELLDRCKDAARLELRGADFSPDDRLDVAADLMLRVLGETAGAPPSRDDRRYSLTVLCGRAANARRKLQRQREHDDAATQAEQDRHAWSVEALTPDLIDSAPEPISAATASEAADVAAWRLSKAPHSVADRRGYVNLWRYLYGVVRDLPEPIIAHELGLTDKAYSVSCSRARVALRERYPSAVDLVRALIDLGASVTDDASKAAHDRTHLLAHDWREGTDAGNWPARPIDKAHADAVCTVRHRRAAPKTADRATRRALKSRYGSRSLSDDALSLSSHDDGAPMTSEQLTADALKRLGQALSR